MGKGTSGRRNSTKGRAKSGITQWGQGSGEQIRILECRARGGRLVRTRAALWVMLSLEFFVDVGKSFTSVKFTSDMIGFAF